MNGRKDPHVKLAIVIAHPVWDERRHEMMARLEAELIPQCEAHGVALVVHKHLHADSHLPGVLEAIDLGLRTGAAHLMTLPDDAVLTRDFVRVALAMIAARPDDILDCVSNHPEAPAALAKGADWYSTIGGSIMIGGIMRAERWRCYLEWRERAIADDAFVAIDDGLNMWATQLREPIYKPLPSPVQHDLSLGSLNGNADQEPLCRTSQVFAADGLAEKDWHGDVIVLGRTFGMQHWNALYCLKPEAWDLEAVYHAHRQGEPVSATPHVLIATPAYQATEMPMRRSRDLVVEDLSMHGISVTVMETPGDSLVTRGRHALQHEFLASIATHLLQWDHDISVDDPACVRRMLESGHDVIGGAYPFRDGSGEVVANRRVEDQISGSVLLSTAGCMPVATIGTGFLLTSRRAIVELAQLHPELLYEADMEPYKGFGMFALFDVALSQFPFRPEGRRRYVSEDWRFCELWRAAGHDVWCFVPPHFQHWGKKGHAGHILDAWKMRRAPEPRPSRHVRWSDLTGDSTVEIPRDGE